MKDGGYKEPEKRKAQDRAQRAFCINHRIVFRERGKKQMDLMEHSYSVLVVSSSAKFNDSLMKLLPETRYGPVITVGDVAAARRCMLERSFDIVVINTPLPDDFGTELALDICESTGTGVLFFVRSDIYHDVNARVSPHGVLTVSKPAPVTAINQSLMKLTLKWTFKS